ncbi:Putative metal ion transporter C17A12.14 [Termitomyces sp. J132]|nr:Putative metal ion transporter C17A12.14 [Termitomyces sp. J132]
MDVDMAMQLSRARRETVSGSPEISPLPEHREEGEHNLHFADIAVQSDPEDESIGITPHASRLDLKMHLNTMHDASLLAHAPPLNHDTNTESLYGLPTYQANMSSSEFDFTPMEEFAAVEKAAFGIAASPTPKFILDAIPRRFPPSGRDPSEAGPSNLPDQLFTPIQSPETDGEDLSRPGPSPGRQRKLSHSHPHPRIQRKGIGGKMALFENLHDPFSGGTPSLGGHTGLSIASRLSGGFGRHTTLNSDAGAQPPTLSGILNAGHDRPYRFSFYSNALAATIHARSLSELPADGQTFEQLFVGVHPEGNDRTWWLDVLSPTDEEMKMLSKVFSIHPLTTEDIQMEETREKIELFRNYYLVCFRSFDQDQYSPTYLEPLNMYIIVFREGILSFHFRPTPHPQNVRRRIKQLKDYIAVTSDWISYALIDDITDAFGPLIQNIEYEVDSIDELVLILKEAEQSDMLRRIGTCRKKVMGLLRLMGNKADVVKGLAKRCNENWRVAPTSDIGLYLSDIQDHLITMTQNLNHYEKILSRSHSNYLAQISIEMTDANNQINDVLSKLTALGTVLIPMNLVTGLWGMNVHVPGQDIEAVCA